MPAASVFSGHERGTRMTLFLTSSPTGCPFEPGPQPAALDPRNHFIDKLRSVWPQEPPEGLLLAADPEAHAANDEACSFFAGCFARAGLPLDSLIPCDSRNKDEIGQLIHRCNFLILGGGHVPTQNRFFSAIGLPALIQNYEGIGIGISAGSMNAARIVYAQPEEPGEATDPHYCRWIPGLGLSYVSIWPHYQHSKNQSVDGQSLMDIALEDSRRRPFMALPDGSYILCSDGHETLYGEGWYFSNGRVSLVNEEGEELPLW